MRCAFSAPNWSRFRPPPTAIRTTMSAFPAGSPSRSPKPIRTARSGRTSSTMSSIARRISKPPRRKSGATPAARSTASSARSAPAARSPASPRVCARKIRVSGSASPIRWVPALYSWYTTGEFKSEGSSITEGIGQGRITANLEGFTPDFACQIHDDEALKIVFALAQEEGMVMGGSTGINIAGAIRLAKELGPGRHHRHRALRLRQPLPVETVQSGIPALQGPPRPRMDREENRNRRAL